MKHLLTFAFIATMSTTSISMLAQSNVEQAKSKAMQAIQLEDEQGKYDEAIALFQEAQKLDPANISYPYEEAYAYSGKKEYKKASDLLEKLLDRRDVHARVYQALGNAYDMQGQAEKAIETYKIGIRKFPHDGTNYLEMGNMNLMKKKYEEALSYYEQGIENDPGFSSNYYWAAKLYCSSEEEVWGMVYGELFLNLEPGSKRSAEMSKLLFETYKTALVIKSETSFEISFSKGEPVSKAEDAFKQFGIGIYEPSIGLAVIGEKSLDINSLDRIRTRFLEQYYQHKLVKNFPNILFDFQMKLKDAGHLEAYNHWLLMNGDEAGFRAWKSANEGKWSSFIKYIQANKLRLNESNRFYRGQYKKS